MTAKPRAAPDPDRFWAELSRKIREHQKVLVGIAVLAAVLVIGVILYATLHRSKVREQWADLITVTTLGRIRPQQEESILEDLARRGDSDLRAHAFLNLAVLRASTRDYEGALRALDRLEEVGSDSPLLFLPSPDSRYSLVQLVRHRIEAEKGWEERNRVIEPRPETGRLALVETSRGAFWVGFLPDLAPEHVKRFVELAKAGAYNGTRVYSVTPTQILFGGAATRDEDPFNDLEDPEDLATIQAEPARFKVRPARGSLSMVALGFEENPYRISIVVGESGAFDIEKRQTVFARVLTDRGPGMKPLDEIRKVTTYAASKDPAIREDDRYRRLANHPVKPPVIERISIWSDGKLEEGHTWDTSAVKPPPDPAKGGSAPQDR